MDPVKGRIFVGGFSTSQTTNKHNATYLNGSHLEKQREEHRRTTFSL
jgi:hypothetical protein